MKELLVVLTLLSTDAGSASINLETTLTNDCNTAVATAQLNALKNDIPQVAFCATNLLTHGIDVVPQKPLAPPEEGDETPSLKQLPFNK